MSHNAHAHSVKQCDDVRTRPTLIMTPIIYLLYPPPTVHTLPLTKQYTSNLPVHSEMVDMYTLWHIACITSLQHITCITSLRHITCITSNTVEHVFAITSIYYR